MGYDGSGTYSRVHSWATDKTNNVKIRADRMDAEFNEIKGALDKTLVNDGQQEWTGTQKPSSDNGIDLGSTTRRFRTSYAVTHRGGFTAETAAVVDFTNAGSVSLLSGTKCDQIDELTTAAGVTIDNCLIKDGVAAKAQTHEPNVTVKTSSGDYTVAATDDVIIINKSSSQITTVTLPAIGTTGRILEIKDGKGDAADYPITIDGNGSETIDGQSTFVLNGNYWSGRVIDNGTEWNII